MAFVSKTDTARLTDQPGCLFEWRGDAQKNARTICSGASHSLVPAKILNRGLDLDSRHSKRLFGPFFLVLAVHFGKDHGVPVLVPVLRVNIILARPRAELHLFDRVNLGKHRIHRGAPCAGITFEL